MGNTLSAAGAALEVLSSDSVPLDSECTASLVPDSLEPTGPGGLLLYATRPPAAAAGASGAIVAVGRTAPAVYPAEGARFARWGKDLHPYAALIGPGGNLLASQVLASSGADVFTGVMESPAAAGELVVLGASAGDGRGHLVVMEALLEAAGCDHSGGS